MVAEGHTVASLTGGIEGAQRDAVIDSFRSGEAKVLITTNVLARGIDVSTVSLVINYVCWPIYLDIFSAHIVMLCFRTFLSWSTQRLAPLSLTTRPTCTVSVVPADSAALVSLSPLSLVAENGRCSTRSRRTSPATSSVLTPVTGTRSKRPSKGQSRTCVLQQTLPSQLEDPALCSRRFLSD